MKRFLLAILLAPLVAFAAYPEKPITLIVAYSPGGGTDLVARGIAPYLEKYLGGGAKIVIVNRAGAGGEVGFAAIANAAPDGYTIGFVNTPPLMTIPIERTAQFGGRSASSCSATSSTIRAISRCTATSRSAT
jgi:tripartite-type tricarboxylate transporter receptor subunit TctC